MVVGNSGGAVEPVLVREYRDEAAFTAEASTLAASGYRVATRAWTRRLTPTARQVAMGGGLAILLAAVSGTPALYVIGVLALGAALVGRVRVLEVTYQK